MTFFTDENFIHKAAALLRAFDDRHAVMAFLDHFPRGTPDVVWIEAVGKWEPKPVILGGDGRILRNAVERAALRKSACTFVYLSSGWTNTPWEAYAPKLLKCWPDVIAEVAKTAKQAVIEVRTTGFLVRYALPG